ncbi:hypothetical protein IV454_25035 [Massilia antarctica]|uniref:Uncharacterized protein n=1 Tax=Massilia antarctica TaxID=2765360 RepID=A0AA48WCI7_9BURK|nr:hypothetical protein [Massilia antarctica]QPI48745.1 hypothetical protein IV454_25035 [Massilia antarctica]
MHEHLVTPLVEQRFIELELGIGGVLLLVDRADLSVAALCQCLHHRRGRGVHGQEKGAVKGAPGDIGRAPVRVGHQDHAAPRVRIEADK